MTPPTMFAARIVTGRDEHGTTYDEPRTREFATLHEAAHTVANDTQESTWDVFSPAGERLARVHVDGGIDSCRVR